MTTQLQSLHACWNQTTGQELHFKATERLFYDLFKMDFTPDDLQCVLMHVIAYNKTHKHAQMKIQAHKLCGDLEVFASILAEARAKERNKLKSPTPKEAIVEAWRGCKPVSNGNCHRLSEFLKQPNQ